jgi:hypothetical protein
MSGLQRAEPVTIRLSHRNWWRNPKIKPLRWALIKTVQRSFSGKKLWAWKDPRTCLTIPLWQSILKQLNTDVCYVIVVRNPLDVAASLKKRNKIPLYRSLNMWSLNTLNALRWTANAPRVIIRYDQFLNDWQSSLKRIAHELEIPWPKNEQQLRKKMNAFIEPDLRHSHSTSGQLIRKKVPSYVLETYRICLQAEESPEVLKTPMFTNTVKKQYQAFLRSYMRSVQQRRRV